MAKQKIVIIPPKVTEVIFNIKGLTPYIPNRMNKDAIKGWEDEKKGRKIRKPKSDLTPEEIAELTVIWFDGENSQPCILGAAFKKAMWTAPRFVDGLTMTQSKGPFQISQELVPFQHNGRNFREDIVRQPAGPKGTPTICYRWDYPDWRCELPVVFDANVLSIEHLANLLNTAGFNVGIGAWRPEKGGNFGRFEVEGIGEIEG